MAIFSGQRLDVDPERGLVGECDFILALTPPLPRLRAPLVTILEAKKGDIEAALGQCLAQMVGARRCSTNGAGQPAAPRCSAALPPARTGSSSGSTATAVVIDRNRLFLDNVGGILGALRSILVPNGAAA